MSDIFKIKSITDAHRLSGLPKPEHPLVSVFSHTTDMKTYFGEIKITSDLYMVMLKENIHGALGYGRNTYDFEEGSMVFIAPGQVFTPPKLDAVDIKGWTLLFHPELIRRSPLAKTINDYSFFGYEMNEALHLSEKEKANLGGLVNKIKSEISQNIDRHSQSVITTSIELLLQYCSRYYDRQFYTRTNLNQGIVTQFNNVLKSYFKEGTHLIHGLPSVKYCAEKLALSPNYFSDLLKKETGRNALDQIHGFIIDKAKNKLLNTNEPISQIAYSLGFDYSQHFSKMFKAKTGMSPKEYRSLN